MIVFKLKKFKISSAVPQKFAFKKNDFKKHIDLEGTSRNITWKLTHKKRPYEAYLLRRVTTISQNNVSLYPELKYSAGFFPVRRKTNYRILPCEPTLQQKRNREACRTTSF